jgi:polyisoprenoid-binding protein YceI
VGFTVRHLVINKVQGKFNEFSGSIIYDENDITKSAMHGRIKVASIDTDNGKRDKHLRSDDFFAAKAYPDITFVSTGVEKQEDAYVLIGDLTMRGVTKKIAISFIITGKIIDPLGQPRIGFEASLNINRQDFAISYSRTMDNGGLVVGNTVSINLVGEACQPNESLKPEHRQSPFVCVQ